MSAMYTSGKALLLSYANLLTSTVNAYLVSGDYTFDPAHTSLASIAAGNREGPVVLAGKSVTAGRFKVDPFAFEEAATPPASVRAVVLVVGANDLLCYLDDFGAGAGGTTIALNGSDIIVTPSPTNGLLYL